MFLDLLIVALSGQEPVSFVLGSNKALVVFFLHDLYEAREIGSF